MANDWFSFKRFTVRQAATAMKVGTDGVLIGAWSTLDDGCRRVLDIGAGTGLISLMAAQRTEPWGAEVVGVELDAAAAEQASENCAASPWFDRLTIINSDIADLALRQEHVCAYDAIVSNPPFFVNSLESPSQMRNQARHTVTLTYEGLLRSVKSLLREGGSFSVVLPWESRMDFVCRAIEGGLLLERETVVYAKRGGPAKRVLLGFRNGAMLHDYMRNELVIRDGDGYTEEYRRVTGDFYSDELLGGKK